MQQASLTQYLEDQLSQYLQDLESLCAIDSGPGNKAGQNRVNDWIDNRLQASGFSVNRHIHTAIGDTLVATLSGTGKGNVLLLGHTDTVFPDGTAAERPVTTEGDKILGPGTCDMKAGLLTGIYALEALQHVGFDSFETLTYVCVADEEVTYRESIWQMRTAMRGKDAVLTLEAARENGDIVVARKGSAVVDVVAHGRSAHAGVEPEKGRNAIVALARRLDSVVALGQPEAGITINVGVISGGTLPNIVPAEAQITLDVRAFHQHELDAVLDQIQAAFATPDDNGVHFSTSYEHVSPAMPLTSETETLEALAKQAAHDLGFAVKGTRTGGAADAAFAATEGVPALDGLGPIGGLDHSPDEYILASSIVPRTALLASLIERICESKTENMEQ